LIFVSAETRYISSNSKFVESPEPGRLAALGSFPSPETSMAMGTGLMSIFERNYTFRKPDWAIRHGQD
jgi:hypothetical protein